MGTEKKDYDPASYERQDGFDPAAWAKNNGLDSLTWNNGSSNGSLGYYGNGGTSGPTANDRKAFDALGSITGFNFQTPQLMNDLNNQRLDINDKGLDNLKNFDTATARRKATNEWYKTQQDLQSVVSQLADASGNMMYGSGKHDFLNLVARADDQKDVEILNTAHENEDAIERDYQEAMQQNINARNEMAMETEQAMRNVAADYLAQGNSIHPDLVGQYLNTKDHTVNLPDWLKTDNFAKDRFRDAVNPEFSDLYRPAMDAQTATNRGLVNRNAGVNNASANSSYWQRMRKGYQRRTE